VDDVNVKHSGRRIELTKKYSVMSSEQYVTCAREIRQYEMTLLSSNADLD
jgi:hypothetical protein